MIDHKTNEQGMIPETLPEYVSYRDGYRYQLAEDYYILVDIYHYQDIETEFITLTKQGLLTLKSGWACDGPSGPTKIICDILTILGCIPLIGGFFNWLKWKILNSIMKGAFVHDALYHLIRHKTLPQATRLFADRELRKICLKDGMSKIRAGWVFKGVRGFADYAADPAYVKKVYHAPM